MSRQGDDTYSGTMSLGIVYLGILAVISEVTMGRKTFSDSYLRVYNYGTMMSVSLIVERESLLPNVRGVSGADTRRWWTAVAEFAPLLGGP